MAKCVVKDVFQQARIVAKDEMELLGTIDKSARQQVPLRSLASSLSVADARRCGPCSRLNYKDARQVLSQKTFSMAGKMASATYALEDAKAHGGTDVNGRFIFGDSMLVIAASRSCYLDLDVDGRGEERGCEVRGQGPDIAWHSSSRDPS